MDGIRLLAGHDSMDDDDNDADNRGSTQSYQSVEGNHIPTQ